MGRPLAQGMQPRRKPIARNELALRAGRESIVVLWPVVHTVTFKFSCMTAQGLTSVSQQSLSLGWTNDEDTSAQDSQKAASVGNSKSS
jgi:hypothetical protein